VKGGERGARGDKRKARGTRHVYCNLCCEYKRMLEMLNDASCVYTIIIMIGMNVVDILNSV
jgi:hypothetical protein